MSHKLLPALCLISLLVACCDDNTLKINGVEECDPECEADEVCLDGECVAESELDDCDPECDVGEICVSGNCKPNSKKVCKPECGEDESCVSGKCEPNFEMICEPECTEDEICEEGECKPDPDKVCDPECDVSEICVHGKCEPDPDYKAPVACSHDVCIVDYADVLSGNAESLGNSFYVCVDGFLSEETAACPENQVCMDGGCVDAFIEGDSESCKIDPSYEFSLFYEDDYGKCTIGGNYAVACKYGKKRVLSCKQPCEDEETGYVRCAKNAEGEVFTYRDIPFDERFVPALATFDDEAKEAYAQVINAIFTNQNEVVINDISKENAQKIRDIVMGRYVGLGSLFGWNWNRYQYGGTHLDNTKDKTRYVYQNFNILDAKTYYKMNYQYELTDENVQQLQMAFNEVLEQADVYETDIEKETFIFNWMALNINYELNNVLKRTYYGTMVQREAVCGGYAQTFAYLMRRLLIPTFYIGGYADNGSGKGAEEHAWNIIQMDGNYYNVDVTWGRIKPNSSGFNNTDTMVKYTYFNVTDDELNLNHKRAEGDLPEYQYQCNATDYSFVALLAIDNMFKMFQDGFPWMGNGFASNIEDYYRLMKENINDAAFEDYESKYLKGSIYALVIGTELYQNIEKLSNEEQVNAYVNDFVNEKYPSCTINSLKSQKYFDVGRNVYLMRTTVFLKK